MHFDHVMHFSMDISLWSDSEFLVTVEFILLKYK